jgi:hypothetical protein
VFEEVGIKLLNITFKEKKNEKNKTKND